MLEEIWHNVVKYFLWPFCIFSIAFCVFSIVFALSAVIETRGNTVRSILTDWLYMKHYFFTVSIQGFKHGTFVTGPE